MLYLTHLRNNFFPTLVGKNTIQANQLLLNRISNRYIYVTTMIDSMSRFKR